MKRLTVLALAMFLALTTFESVASALWVPVVAKQRRLTTRVAPDGMETVVREVRGDFLRSSEGIELQSERAVVDGKETGPEVAVLMKRALGEVHQLVPSSKRAYVKRSATPQESPLPKSSAYLRKAHAKALDRGVVNGLTCYAYPVRRVLIGKDGSTVIGRVWRSLDYDLSVKSETEEANEDGSLTRTLIEIYDIQVGVEPDKALVSIPSDYKIVDDVSKIPQFSACPTCGSGPQ